ncbi:oligomeric golgi complex component, COG2-domain-containing protein [Triangularia verruculosa]|uniref:Conserved oligomeric Golgi complex subunit 2 n=1 Tax=Triangularia verruculosa TaxID=2587418 RepID=A0AAN6XDS7_9PEZI|nr:oligomeric golgi complex component, COG2-domain-containing protein [Triangularia verruculosa]
MAQLGLPPTSRPTSSYSNFNLHSPPSPKSKASRRSSLSSAPSDDDLENSSSLPFPAALSRRDFLAPDFDPANYLSTLHTGGPASRHQTLEDLRAELRDRSSAISAELLELVNSNYTAFLGLGDELKGGEERVEDVRVALLGFRRAVEEVQSRVRERGVEVGGLNRELKDVKGAVETGRKMLELDERVAGLEKRLAVGGSGRQQVQKRDDDSSDEEDWDDDDEIFGTDDEGRTADEGGVEFVSSSPAKLAALAKEYAYVEGLADTIGRDLSFVKKTEERIFRCRSTILLDLSTAMREARKAGAKGQGRVIKLLAIYGALDAQVEAVKVLKEK